MGSVHWELTADEEKFLGSCLRAHNALAQVGQAGQQAGQRTGGAFGAATNSIMGFVGAITGIGGVLGAVSMAVAQIRKEMEFLAQQRARAAEAQLTVAGARNLALFNKPADVGVEWLDQTIRDTATRRGISEVRAWTLASSMLSSKGALSEQQFAAAMDQAARAGAVAPELDLATLGGGIQDIMKITGVQDPRRAAGWIGQVGAQARIVALDKQSRALVRSISGAAQMGATPEQAAEFMAFLTMRTGDIEGEQSSTAIINFMKQLAEATTERGAMIPTGASTRAGKLFGGGVNAAKFRALTGGTFMERLTELQDWYAKAPEELRNEFLSKLEGRGAAKAGLLALIARDPTAMAELATIQGAITEPTGPGVAELWEQRFADVRAGRQEPVAILGRRFTRARETAQTGRAEPGIEGEIEAGMGDLLADVPGMGHLGRWARLRKLKLQGRTPEAALEMLDEVERHYTGEQIVVGGEAGRRIVNPRYNPELQQAVQELRAALMEVADQLRRGKPQPVTVVGGQPNPNAHTE